MDRAIGSGNGEPTIGICFDVDAQTVQIKTIDTSKVQISCESITRIKFDEKLSTWPIHVHAL